MNETDFEDIEKQKENIQPLKEGRSAKMLSVYLSSDSDRLKQEHEAKFEEKLKHLDEEDDPLHVYVSYVQWIENAYASGLSPLLKVVERAVRQFKNDARYKNDPRFLKLWLIVAHQAKEPMDVFKYLSINGIGSHLSLYYEEYASLLEKNGRYDHFIHEIRNKEAMDVYKHGIQKEAQPLERLKRRFVEFQKRMVIMPTVPDDQTQFSGISGAKKVEKKPTVKASKSKKESKSKPFTVFNDEDKEVEESENLLPSVDNANPWSEYAKESERVKENRQDPTPWTGATCPQVSVPKKKNDKFSVFKDDNEENDDHIYRDKKNDRALSVKKTVHGKSKNRYDYLDDLLEGICNETGPSSSKTSLINESNLACDKNIVFKNNMEYSFEESRFANLCQKQKDIKNMMSKEKESASNISSVNLQKEIEPVSGPNHVKKDKPPKQVASPTINTKAAMQDVFEMFSKPLHASVWEDEDETISAKVYQPERLKIGVFHDNDNDEECEIKSALPNTHQREATEAPDSSSLPDRSTKTPKLISTYPLQSTPLIGGMDENVGQRTAPATVIRPSLRPFDIMTPITEVSEDRTFAGLSTIRSDKIGSSISGDDSIGSYLNQHPLENENMLSPFSNEFNGYDKKMDFPDQTSSEVLGSLLDCNTEKENECNYEMMDIPNPCNPYDSTIIQAILESVPIPANSGLNHNLDETKGLQKDFDRALSTASSKSKVDFVFSLSPKEKYKLIKKIGHGGYGQVYLVNRYKSGLLEEQDDEYTVNCTFSSKKMALAQLALKLESPPAPWEFYILSLLRSRLPMRVNDSIAKPVSCHLFKDESALLMEYMNQGTLLNCVNLANSGGYGAGSSGVIISNGQSGVDELLAAFWTIELLRIIETIHAAGVIHGDIKPDNVMIRMLDAGSDWESIYRADGSGGWNSKGLSLIDWGSAIDVLSFPEDQKFIKIKSSQDSSIECWQVRNGKPWTYEIDWYGAAAVIHVLLFGTYMSVVESDNTENPHLELKSQFKRYWNISQWKGIFDVLLNAGTYNTELLQQNISESITVEDSLLGPGTDFEVLEQEFPLIQKIHDKRLEMEIWLRDSCCSGGKSLRNLLRRVEIALLDSSS